MKRDLISLKDFSREEVGAILDSAAAMKTDRLADTGVLAGKTLGLLFTKPSNRTRVSFEVGIRQLGGQCVYLGPEEINLGVRETTADVARTLSRYLDGIVARVHGHGDVIELGRHSSAPVINGLSDLYHPCQALADLLSIRERFTTFDGLTLAYIGDGNNVCHSLMLGCALTGLRMSIAAPASYAPDPDVLALARSLSPRGDAAIQTTADPRAAVGGAQIIYADVWTSMGQEAEARRRLKDFQGYQINDGLCVLADPDFVFMHCLPAHRGEEVTAGIIDGPHSIVFDQAENRLHAQKAVLKFLFSYEP